MRFERTSGILLHPTSLAGRFGVGDFGREAYRFVDWLAAAGQAFWQIMPLGPTGYGDSPYSSFSAFAGNTNLVSPEQLVESGLLTESDIQTAPDSDAARVDYGKVIDYKRALLEKAFVNFKSKLKTDDSLRDDYVGFLDFASAWLEDWALFAALKDEHDGESWHKWEAGLARREAKAVESARAKFAEQIEAHKFFQYVFFRQWLKLKRYANERGVRVIGDMPIFVAHNSADVWARPRLFKLKDDGSPRAVAGVPPDAFSETGQLWGNPLYDWDRMREDGFSWWVGRVRETLKIVDVIRLDHFRGFAAYWEVPAEHETAERGRWVDAPGREVFNAMRSALGGALPIIAEDLGTITPDVHRLRDEFNFPGMRVLQFAFGGDPHDTHLPHEYVRNTVAYTGTHDNDTVVGWLTQRSREDASEGEKRELKLCLKYLGTDGREINWDFIRAAQMSVAVLSIAQLQDVLGLGADARMNTPASAEGNWAWRFEADALTDELAARLRETTAIYGRLR
ncbi:MAG TPA: 4-alpha-glucanotransferase [Pyrinomonadaceae bacterium]|jgi:4-alpha-glucanotransferase|nr:4-alpha-glucanotransferase [Pyrinomonadaceae bacterium]